MKANKLEIFIGLILVIIGLCVGVIEYSNYKISTFNNEITDLEIGATNMYLDVMTLQMRYLHFDLYNIIQPNIDIFLNESGPECEKNSASRFISGNLNKEQHLYQMKECAYTEYKKSINRANDAREQIRTKYRNGTIYTKIRNIILFVEFILILLAIYLYVILLKNKDR